MRPSADNAQVWAFDVDGTLVGSIRSGSLRPGAVELLLALAARSITCVLWSAGGAEYARRTATRHHIQSYFVAFYGKGERGPGGRYAPGGFDIAHRPTVFVDDSPIDLPVGAQIVAVAQFLGNNFADRVLLDLLDGLDQLLMEGRR